jgi:putative hydrolase of the HAD superfamily
VKPRAILFDLDCTLTDRRASLAKYVGIFVDRFRDQLRDVDEELILEKFARFDQFGYLPRAQCWGHLLENLAWNRLPLLEELDGVWDRHWPGCAIAAAGAVVVLHQLCDAGFVLGMITNGKTLMQQRKIEHLGIGRFMKLMLISEAVGIAKPQRGIFDHACGMLGFSAGEVWFVGDHPINDAIGAKNAGMVDVWLRGGVSWPLDREGPTHVIENLAELRRMVDF